MTRLLCILALFLAFGCCKTETIVQPEVYSMPAPPDSDCDGVIDSLDLCPGINDLVDNNNDGKPDCKYPPGYSNVISEWKCGSPSLQKVVVCTKTPSGGRITVCTYYSALQTHINAGGNLGKCNSSTCN